MLALSIGVIVASGGTSLLACGIHVICVALTASVTPLQRAPVVLVPGKRLTRRDAISRVYRQRLDRAVALYQAGIVEKVALLGGPTRSPVSESAAGAAYLQANGIPIANISLEDRSHHTLENLRFWRDYNGSDASLLLTTSRTHLARCRLMAKGLGLQVTSCAAESARTMSPRLLWEAFLVHWYLTGFLYTRCTGNVAMRSRIS